MDGANGSDIHFLLNVYAAIYNLDSNCYKKIDFCKSHFISYETMSGAKDIVEKIKKTCHEAGFLHTRTASSYGSVNVNQNNWDLIHACFVSALYPNTSFIDRISGRYDIQSLRFERIQPHFSSIVRGSILNESYKNWILYFEKQRTDRDPTVRVSNMAIVSSMALLLFAGRQFELHQTEEETRISIDGIIQFKVSQRMGNLLVEVRRWAETQFDRVIRFPETYGMTHESGRAFEPILGSILRR